VVLALNTRQQSRTYVGSFVGDCISFMVVCSLNFLPVRRETNQAIHYLAKLYTLHNLD